MEPAFEIFCGFRRLPLIEKFRFAKTELFLLRELPLGTLLDVRSLCAGPAVRGFGPEFREWVFFAIMLSCGTDIPPIEYQTVVDVLPVLLGNKRFKVF